MAGPLASGSLGMIAAADCQPGSLSLRGADQLDLPLMLFMISRQFSSACPSSA